MEHHHDDAPLADHVLRPASVVIDDPVLADLHRAEEFYRALRARAARQSEELTEARAELSTLQQRERELSDRLVGAERDLAAERRHAQSQRERADQLREMVCDLHRGLFSGNIYNNLLRTCLTLAAAERGLYVTVRGRDGRLRIRAAVDVNDYPDERPSPFIEALCRRVSQSGEGIVWRADQPTAGLPQPDRQGEHFRNCIAAPVVLNKNFDGIIIAADKLHGDFGPGDIDALLSVGDHATVAMENVRLQRELQSAYLSTVSMLADAVEAKDPYTHGHCEMVSRLARLTAERLDLSAFDRALCCYAALLHDVGKIGVSDGVLNKPGPLLPEERELVRSHVRVGHDLLRTVPALATVAEVVLHHHEWWDGTGYPEGLKGEAIPVASRVVAAVDAYSAMVTRRSYKEAYSDEHAREELRRMAGSQFDPHVIEALLAALDSPEARDADLDNDAECGVLPGFVHPRELRGSAA